MTCICGVVKGGTVWLGGDSAATSGGLDRTIIKDPKVFVRGEVALGVCGYPKVMDAVAHVIEFPTQTGSDDRAFLVGELIPAIREGLVKLDAASKGGGPFGGDAGTTFEGAMLLGYRGCLYNLEMNFQLVQPACGFAAVGSGGEAAMGSLRATKGMSNPRKRLLKALEVSAEANAGVAPPFVVVMVKKRA